MEEGAEVANEVGEAQEPVYKGFGGVSPDKLMPPGGFLFYIFWTEYTPGTRVNVKIWKTIGKI